MRIHAVADLVVDTLQKAGVGRIYGLSGDSLSGVTEALRSRGANKWVHLRHEESAAFAAAAEARMTGGLPCAPRPAGRAQTHLTQLVPHRPPSGES